MRGRARTVTRVGWVREPEGVRLVDGRRVVLYVLEVPDGKRVDMGGYMRLVGAEPIIFRGVARVGELKRCAESIHRDKASIGKEGRGRLGCQVLLLTRGKGLRGTRMGTRTIK